MSEEKSFLLAKLHFYTFLRFEQCNILFVIFTIYSTYHLPPPLSPLTPWPTISSGAVSLRTLSTWWVLLAWPINFVNWHAASIENGSGKAGAEFWRGQFSFKPERRQDFSELWRERAPCAHNDLSKTSFFWCNGRTWQPESRPKPTSFSDNSYQRDEIMWKERRRREQRRVG